MALRGLFRAVALTTTMMTGGALQAQENGSWVQIAARPGAADARATASGYADVLDAVAGYRLGGSRWYAVVIGPFDEDTAEATRQRLRAQRLIPGDAFVTDGQSFGTRIYPDGAALSRPETPSAAVEPAEPRAAPDESRAEALRSERALTAEERRELQVALRWAGVYDAGIDGAFGRGTRTAMAEWQALRGFDATGVLTTRQRAALIAEYDAVLDGLDMERVRDATAGIVVEMPTARVAFDRHAPPFAHYEAVAEDDAARVLLISQAGGRAELRALYEIMQTLEIVPESGAREFRGDAFTLTGEGREIVSETRVRLLDGQIKGWTLVWPAGDEARRRRVVEEMAASFAVDGSTVMGDRAGDPGEEQSIDLLAGLRIRKPATVRSGFYVTRRGDVLTTADATEGCSRITLDGDVEAEVAGSDPASGLALLAPVRTIAPRGHAAFRRAAPRLNSTAVLSGFSFDGALSAATLTYGTLSDMRGLDGDDRVKRFALEARSGDAGGPVFDTGGGVLGMLLPRGEDGRSLPEDVAFAADTDTVLAFLDGLDIDAQEARDGAALARGTLERRARDMTVLVGCWD